MIPKEIRDELPNIQFYLSGSRFFEYDSVHSDWDLVCQFKESNNFSQYGFTESSTPKYYFDTNTVRIWKKENIEVIECYNIQKRLHADSLIKWYGASLPQILKQNNKTYVTQLYNMIYGMMNKNV